MNRSIAGTDRTYKPFPPGLGHVKVPISSRRASVAALGLYSACKGQTHMLQRVAVACVRIFGARVLPGRAEAWIPPMDLQVWKQLVEGWQGAFGEFDDIAIHERTQSERPGVALLLIRGGTPVAFVKLRRGGKESALREYAVMRTVWEFRPHAFSIPEPLNLGSVDGWSYLATASLSSPEHRVSRRPPLPRIESEITEALRGLERPDSIPPHWLPMHGDFTPWNLRETTDGALMLYDWEDAGWGPPLADDVLYRASYAALRSEDPGAHPGEEAVRFWMKRVEERPWVGERDRRLALTLTRALERMLPPHPRRAA